MKRLITLFAIAIALSVGSAAANAQVNAAKPKSAPLIIKFQAHSMHANDFMSKMSKDRTLAAEVHNKGLDLAFTEWMQRDHPLIFRKVCIKQSGEIAREFKSTNHMEDFDVLINKRGDLRMLANKYGHDYAFAEWLRTEKPDVYRQHFGLDAHNKPIKQ